MELRRGGGQQGLISQTIWKRNLQCNRGSIPMHKVVRDAARSRLYDQNYLM